MLLNKDHSYNGEEKGFRERFICNKCDTQFIVQPDVCPVCEFFEKTKKKIENMTSQEDFHNIVIDITNNLEESIPKLDLLNILNKKRKALGIK